MDANLTDEERLAEIKKWWKENGGSIITGVILGLAVLFGGKAWFAHQEKKAETASDNFAVMMSSLNIGNDSAVREKAGILLSDYSSTPYAALAALTLARVNTEAGELLAARSHLQWVLDNNQSDVMQAIAQLRMARVLLAMNELDSARDVLSATPPGDAFAALFAEVRGDIAMAGGEQMAASKAYQQALDSIGDNAPGRHLLQLKYDNTLALTQADSGAAE